MKRRGILTGLAVLVLLSASVVVARFGRLQGGNDGVSPAVAEQKTAPAHAPKAGGSPLARCRPAADDDDRIVVREGPSANSNVIARVGHAESAVTRLDARSVKGRGDWIQVQLDERTGWVDGAEVICRFTPEEAQQVIAAQAAQVLDALAARNMRVLATHVHPIKGLRFSPYVDVDPKRSVVLAAPDVPKAFDDRRPRVWGSEDGTGDPISRSFAEYYTRFVYDREFASGAHERFNEFGAKSTTQSNLWELYPNAIVVEYHVPGTKPESEGMDWASLLLVFEQHESRWYVSAIVHDQWTI
jgi:hypothetical protein